MRRASFTLLALAAAALLSAGARTLPAESKPGLPEAQWEKHVQSLVEQLGHDEFQRREAAQRALLQEGPKILPVLDKLAPPSDPEIQVRLRRIRYQLQGFLNDIRGRLSALPEIDDSRPPLPEDLKHLILLYQPRSGDFLLSIIGNADDKLNRRATNAFLHTWESMTPVQIQSYLQLAMTPYAKLRQQYPQSVDAMIEMGYHVRYGWGGWPPDTQFEMKTVTTHVLDGKAYGKPFSYQGPLAGTGWLRTKDQALGKHSFHLVTEYQFVRDKRTYTGRAESQTYDFEMVAADTPNDLVAPDDPATDQLVREALQFSEIRLEVRNGPIQVNAVGDVPPERDPWEPQITWKSGDGRCGSLHMPLWKLTRELPVDLCFEVEFHIEGTGDVFAGDPLVVFKGKRVDGYFSPRGLPSEFAKGKEGLIPLRIVLRPSRALALTYTDVTQYYSGTITSPVLRAKAEHH
jgi:hypothetical protein